MSKAGRADNGERDTAAPSRKAVVPSWAISRREFCQAVPWAFVGGLAFSSFKEKSSKGHFLIPPSQSSRFEKEDDMAKKVTAVIARVKSLKGTCSLGHKVGDEVKFTESGVEGKICIHALYSMLPAVFAMMYEAQFPWLKENPDKKTHACPDAYNPLIFEIERIRE
jgi:uncharacterized repeat protein (TIGR04076 family)